MSKFNDKGNNTNSTKKTNTKKTDTKKARTAAGTSAKSVFRRPTAKQVEQRVDALYRKGVTPPPVEILYLAKATDAERKTALKAFLASPAASKVSAPSAVAATSSGNPLSLTAAQGSAPVILLAIDLGYHRDPRKYYVDNRQKGLTENFSLQSMDPLRVSYRDGILWVVDGGRRLMAAIENGYKELPICFVDDWTREKEAEVYAKQNLYRIMLSLGQQHKAGLVAGEEIPKRLEALCAYYGMTICRDSGKNEDRPFRAIGTANKILNRSFGDVSGNFAMSWIFSTIDKANWFNCQRFQKAAVSSIFLNAFAAVLDEAEKTGKRTQYGTNLNRALVQLSPQLIYAYAHVEYPLMSRQGSTNTIMKAIARGTLKAPDILKVVPIPNK